MTCESCVDDVRRALRQQDGVESYDIDLAAQRVIVQGRLAPSKISRVLKDTGRQVIVRGAGTSSGAFFSTLFSSQMTGLKGEQASTRRLRFASLRRIHRQRALIPMVLHNKFTASLDSSKRERRHYSTSPFAITPSYPARKSTRSMWRRTATFPREPLRRVVC